MKTPCPLAISSRMWAYIWGAGARGGLGRAGCKAGAGLRGCGGSRDYRRLARDPHTQPPSPPARPPTRSRSSATSCSTRVSTGLRPRGSSEIRACGRGGHRCRRPVGRRAGAAWAPARSCLVPAGRHAKAWAGPASWEPRARPAPGPHGPPPTPPTPPAHQRHVPVPNQRLGARDGRGGHVQHVRRRDGLGQQPPALLHAKPAAGRAGRGWAAGGQGVSREPPLPPLPCPGLHSMQSCDTAEGAPRPPLPRPGSTQGSLVLLVHHRQAQARKARGVGHQGVCAHRNVDLPSLQLRVQLPAALAPHRARDLRAGGVGSGTWVCRGRRSRQAGGRWLGSTAGPAPARRACICSPASCPTSATRGVRKLGSPAAPAARFRSCTRRCRPRWCCSASTSVGACAAQQGRGRL